MTFTEKNQCTNPIETASPISKLFFLWLFPLLKHGAKKELRFDDLYGVPSEDESGQLGMKLQAGWEDECSRSKESGCRPRYYKPLLRMFWKEFVLYGCVAAINECILRVAQTLFLHKLLGSFITLSPIEDQLFYAFGIILCSLIYTLILHPISFEHQHIGMKCSVASCALIYRKALKLSKSAQNQTTVGQMLNLLSNDVNRFETNLMVLHFLHIAPIQMMIFTYFLWTSGGLGVSCLAGVAFIVLLTPLQYYISLLLRRFTVKVAQRTDRRGQIMNEMIIAIRVIKMYAWEKAFTILVDNVRRAEVKILRKSAYLRAFYLSVYMSSSTVITFLTILIYILCGGELKADTVFFMVTVYNIIRQTMVQLAPSALATAGDLIVSMDRIQTFLLLDEQTPSENRKIVGFSTEGQNSFESLSVAVTNVKANWTLERPTLEDVNVNLRGDKLIMIVGPVGSGKTSFLHTILGELPINEGHCKIKGKIAYNSQEPWIFPGNIKQNILVGQSYNKERFSQVIRMSALEEDLKQLPFGENTIVGDRGTALSGGQKSRVNLARTLYQDADIYLLDDPLSAVDTEVSRHIFENCIRKQLQGKLRILVTHQLQYLPKADHVIVFNGGKILVQGTYCEVVDQGIDFVSLLDTDIEDGKQSESSTKLQTDYGNPNSKTEINEDSRGKPVIQTERIPGVSVNWKAYIKYLLSGNSALGLITLVLGYAVTQIVGSGTDYWLAHWVSQTQNVKLRCNSTDVTFPPFEQTSLNISFQSREKGDIPYKLPFKQDLRNNDDFGGTFNFYVYTTLVILVVVLTSIRALYFFRYCVNISSTVHSHMFENVVRAPIKFFDDNPSGRILNRFTKDIGAIDEQLPPTLFDVLSMFLQIIGIIVVVLTSNYYIIIPCVVLVAVMYLIRRFYLKTAGNVKRMEATSLSPVLTHLSTTVQGLTTIRSLGCEHVLTQQFDRYQDLHFSASFAYISINRWLSIWMELTALIFLAIVVFSFIVVAEIQGTGSGSSDAGLAISSAITFSGMFQVVSRKSAKAENLLTSVDRVLEYSKMKPESSLSNSDTQVPKNWPAEGAIKFHQVCLSYNNKCVLKDLTFEIRGKEKIGIVGRTGAGKSSIVACLFRMVEATGDIYIDSFRTRDVGLDDIRKNISIIPQDPVLFSGTIRYNLDPFGQFNDDQLWKVIEEVELKDSIPVLDFQVADGGSNFSVGEKQLVCLARAILRQNKIIVMDEATANMDPRTDNNIQTTIRSKFSQCTIITIAHRLRSVIDCDRILVLDNGYLKEYGHPNVLLQNPDGFLTSMVNHMGKANVAILKKLAKETYLGRRGSFQATNAALIAAMGNGTKPDILGSSFSTAAN